jgi:mycothiol synthase
MLALRTEPELAPPAATQLATIAEQLEAMAGDAFGALLAGPGPLADAVAIAARNGAHHIDLEIFPSSPEHDVVAGAAGFARTRCILQLRRRLPVTDLRRDAYPPLTTRPFRPGTDDEAHWLEVNNRAFAWHPDQHDQTLDDLHAHMAEPWFDPEGFLLHEVDGRLAAFCWTKRHDKESPPAGEIFVIGVDPDFQGHGLGGPMTLAGLDWLGDQGLTVGLLYVESTNAAALRVYAKLGFVEWTSHRFYRQVLRAG